MEKKNALAFKKFVMEAEEALLLIMKEKDALDVKELERLKECYNDYNLVLFLLATDNEIVNNCINYDNDFEIIITYLKSLFGDLTRHNSDGNERKFQIIEGDFEVEYLLKLDKELKSSFDAISFYGQNPFRTNEDLIEYLKFLCEQRKEIDDLKEGKTVVDGHQLNNPRFDFKLLKNELEESKMSYSEKFEFVNNRLFDFLQWQQLYDVYNESGWKSGDSKYDITNLYYPKFENLCRLELERLEVLKDKVEAPPKPLPKAPVVVRPASKRKTDIIKIISAMYDNRMFANAEGNPHTNKQALMEAFGEFFGEDFTTYSTLLSQAKDKSTDVFLKVFDDIKKSAKQYHEN